MSLWLNPSALSSNTAVVPAATNRTASPSTAILEPVITPTCHGLPAIKKKKAWFALPASQTATDVKQMRSPNHLD